MTTQQTLIQRIKSNLEDKIPAWEELEWWDSLLDDDTTSCLEPNNELDKLTWDELSDLESDTIPDDTLPLCKVEETIDLTQVVWTDLQSIKQDKILDLGKVATRAHIELVDKTTKIKVPPMQYTGEDKDEFAKQIQELLDANLIEPSKSPHFSPAFLVNKHSEHKRGKRRMVINYKKLNDHTIGDGYLLPRKDELLDQIRGKKIFSSFDCKSGFWQVLLDDSSQSLTCFHMSARTLSVESHAFWPKAGPIHISKAYGRNL